MGGTNDRIQHDLGAALAGITMATLPAELWLKAEATNFLATEWGKTKEDRSPNPIYFCGPRQILIDLDNGYHRAILI